VARQTIDDFKGESRKIKQLIGKSKKYAITDATIMIQGETGTGKGLLAESIHNLSHRKNEPFVAVNCPALPESLLESELFGYEEGAFTGAKRGGKIGLFELANRGTIFLDEIADIPQSLQIRLLRVIEAKEVMRVGGERYVPIDVRIISSSNKDLRREVKKGRFRADLYFRLAVLKLNVPPIRDRFEDIHCIIKDLIDKYQKDVKSIVPHMKEEMKRYHWPGNIRELKSFIESYFILLGNSRGPNLDLFSDLLNEYTNDTGIDSKKLGEKSGAETSSKDLKDRLNEYERIIIAETLKDCEFSKKATAKRLGISVNTLWRKLQPPN
jgi:propionate catabolism operon transcriptional regulator